MIKAVTTNNKVHGTEREMEAEVELSGNKMEILHEFLCIFDSLEESCPDVLLTALQLYKEDK